MRYHKRQRGFTMVELLVVIGIFSVMTGVVLGKYRTYNTNALFANASEDIVLALRQAQVYGVGVKGSGTNFDIPYGVWFTVGLNNFVIFADADGNGLYGAGDSVVETITWPSTIIVNAAASAGLSCDADVTTVSYLSITFKRPNPDAIIKRGSGVACVSSGSVKIIDLNTSKTATVKITSAGQISLQ